MSNEHPLASPAPPPPGGNEGQPLLSNGNNNVAEVPAITHYYGGDINLNPNTGESNVVSEEVMGLTLSEMVFKLQWSCTMSCLILFTYEVLSVFVWPVELVTFKFAHLVLSAYILFFALALLCLEVFFTMSMIYNKQIIPEVWIYRLIDNFGFMFHPMKKACFIIFLTFQILFTRQRTWIEYLLGVWWIGNSIATIYVWYKYPEFRRHTHKLRVAARTRMISRTDSFKALAWQSWSYYQGWNNKNGNATSSMTTDV